jgi:hypothetical protein
MLEVISTLCLLSCSKKSTFNYTTYTFIDKAEIPENLARMEYNSNLDVRIIEYNGNDTIAINKIKHCEPGKKYPFRANEKAEKINARFTLTITDPDDGRLVESSQWWTKSMIYLNKGENIEVDFKSELFYFTSGQTECLFDIL